ncbi:nucleoside-diphosphate-sugar epimerase [Arcticibacter tournemirensis]|uniref:NAD(P)-dependent oxidoreductase n=1 Tax=Arcticibacter tournemirensis TaxID=699437 RepID=A0A5M9H0H7_9SPHI|nr:NAD(P)-dependent oxidoreductase [Arcticibacter tournemirensis]KAA8480070.1 NAD(P)-dependent oxidoreductase [Arcticibacter tournemirensis]TQM50671.1 nucleoside-diphosphate-sugar epimerase [Arcticibacter tournemirensis]
MKLLYEEQMNCWNDVFFNFTKKIMKVLVTGSAGKLGSAVMQRLRSAGLTAIGADLIESPYTDVILDIKDKAGVLNVCRQINAVIHTAAIHGKHYDLDYPREAFVDTNICGTLNLLNASVQHRIQHFLYISTTSVYGTAMVDPLQAVWVDESLTEQPRDIYDITKQAAEQLCKDFFYKEGLHTSVYRVGRFLPEDPNVEANHRLYRGLDERDGAEALYLGLSHHFERFEIFNISSSSPFTKDDLIGLKKNPSEAIIKLYPQAAEIYKINGWSFPESIDRLYVTDKARELLGYSPKYTFDYLLKKSASSDILRV